MAGLKGQAALGLMSGIGSAFSKVLDKFTPGAKTKALLTGTAVTGAVGFTALELEEAIRGSNSVLGHMKQMEANTQAAAQSKGFWSGLREGLANFLEFLELIPGVNFAKWKASLRENNNRGNPGPGFVGDLSRTLGNGDPASIVAFAAAPTAGLVAGGATYLAGRNAVDSTKNINISKPYSDKMIRGMSSSGGASADSVNPSLAKGLSEKAEKSEGNMLKHAFSKVKDGLLHTKMGRVIGIGATAVAGAALFSHSADAAELGTPANTDAAPIYTTPAPATNTPAAEQGFWSNMYDTTTNFAKGLYNEATDTNNWTIGNAANLASAGAHGLVDGTAYLGSFAYANTVGWFTGQSTDEVHEKYIGKAVNAAFENTVGMPDLSGHWAQAVHGVAELGMPAKAAGIAGIKLVKAFNLAEKTGVMAGSARFGLRTAPQLAMPSPSGM